MSRHTQSGGHPLATWIALAATLVVSACAANAPAGPASTITVYRHTNALQCQPGSGIPIAEMEGVLRAAGVTVFRSQCGSDGFMHAQACGSPGGSIAIFEIDDDHSRVAEALGYGSMDRDLPNGRPGGSCR